MKIGFRKPSIKKSIKARTTGKIKRKAKKAVNPLYGKKGMGYIKDPNKAIKNKVYHKTTFGANDVIRAGSSLFNNSGSVKHGSIRNSDLLNLQRVVIPNSPNNLVMPKQQLLATAKQQAENDIRIVQDSTNAVSTTNKPDVYFSRLDLLKQHTYHMQLLEPYIPFTVSPTAAMNELIANENELTKQFIYRYFLSVDNYAKTLKTQNGMRNQYVKFHDTMKTYQNQMSTENNNYVEQLYAQAISSFANTDTLNGDY